MEKHHWTWKQRLYLIAGVLKAALLVAGAYIVGFGLLILLLCLAAGCI